MYEELEGKVAIVTGAGSGGSGIGRAIALTLAREGVSIVVNDINQEGAEKVADEINSIRCQALAIVADVTRSEEVHRMVKTALSKFGTIDILVNNAGGHAKKDASFFNESREEVWDKVLNLNLKGTLNCSRAVVNHMIERRQGKIVNIASIAGQYGRYGLADYAAAKGGIISFTKSLAQELGAYGINVNCVAPGLMERKVVTVQKEIAENPFWGAIPLGRRGKPEDVADVVAFLVSDRSRYITGECIRVSGGV